MSGGAGYSLVLADHVHACHVESASFGSARRAELSKRGTANLRARHPAVDMAERTSLIELRKSCERSCIPSWSARDQAARGAIKTAFPGIGSSQLH